MSNNRRVTATERTEVSEAGGVLQSAGGYSAGERGFGSLDCRINQRNPRSQTLLPDADHRGMSGFYPGMTSTYDNAIKIICTGPERHSPPV